MLFNNDREKGQTTKTEIQKTFGVSLTCVGSRWQWNKRGAIGESTLVGRFFLLHFKGLHTTGGDGKEQKLHNPITFFFHCFFFIPSRLLSPSRCIFFCENEWNKRRRMIPVGEVGGMFFLECFFFFFFFFFHSPKSQQIFEKEIIVQKGKLSKQIRD